MMPPMGPTYTAPKASRAKPMPKKKKDTVSAAKRKEVKALMRLPK